MLARTGWIIGVLVFLGPALSEARVAPKSELTPPEFRTENMDLGVIAPLMLHSGEKDGVPSAEKLATIREMLGKAYDDEKTAQASQDKAKAAIDAAKAEIKAGTAAVDERAQIHNFASFADLKDRQKDYPALYGAVLKQYNETVGVAEAKLTAAEAQYAQAATEFKTAKAQTKRLETILIAMLQSMPQSLASATDLGATNGDPEIRREPKTIKREPGVRADPTKDIPAAGQKAAL